MPKKVDIPTGPAELRRRAEARWSAAKSDRESVPGAERVLYELEVHQIELEMQNAELHRARNELEVVLERYTDLYDFAPVGYFSIDESGVILATNLTGAALIGVERSRLINRRFSRFVSEASRSDLQACLDQAFAGSKDVTCDALIVKEDGRTFWAGFRATLAISLEGTRSTCRVAFGDITARRQAEDAQRRVDALSESNLGLNREIARREKVEKALQESEKQQRELLKQSRRLSHQVLQAQEEERKRISRELHDEIAQTLVGVNVHLATLARTAAGRPKDLERKIAGTQRLVEKAVESVHRFARELRPTTLDHLGLIPTLDSYMKEFTKRTGVLVRLTAFAAHEKLNIAERTVLYRVAQEALTNVARHAKASRVNITIEKLPNRICMKLADDGKSFRVERVLQSRKGKHLGLLGMRERLEMVGGSLSVESAPGKGTTITAEIPFGKARARDRSALK